MRVLKPLLVLIVILIVVALFTPQDIRDGNFFYAYGRVLDALGNSGAAAGAYKTSFEAMPGNIRFVRSYVRALNDIGERTESESHFVTAYDVANQWIEDHEGHDQVWQMHIEKARAEWGKGSRGAAKVSIDTAVELMPTDYYALVCQGIIYRDIQPNNKDAVGRSISIFEQAIEVRHSTRTYWAHFELAKAYWMLRDEARALNELDQAISQFPPRRIRIEAERLKHEIQSSGRSER